MNTDFHRRWWFRSGLNRKPSPYEGDALTNWATEPYGGRCRIRTALQDPKTRVLPLHHILHIGAGDGNRTRVSTLEGWRSTIELHRRRSQPEFHWSHYCGRRFTGCRYNFERRFYMNFTTGMGNSPMQSTPSHNRAFTLCLHPT